MEDGASLHASVPPSDWCITKKDLKDFRKLVCEEIDAGRIIPTPLDPFDPGDRLIGPNMYTVLPFIVDVTSKAGNMSWALMKHPDGLKCDIFITHAWHEGVFEFVDKVLHSWPRGGHYAYCCVLSNPQNLDIGHLISTPRSSPFAKALASASVILVVPNRKVSVYSRLWCVYEAFLAYSWDKYIFTARAPVRGVRWTILIVVLFTCGFVTNSLISRSNFTERWIAYAFSSWCACLLMLVAKLEVLRILNYVGAVGTGVWGSGFCQLVHDRGELNPLMLILWGSHIVLFIVVFSLSEYDRLGIAQHKAEAAALQVGYSGRLLDAQCSVFDDAVNIFDELVASGAERDVEDAIAILLRAGISTPHLRLAAARGVVLDGAGHSRLSLVVLAWCTWFREPLVALSLEHSPETTWLVCLVLIQSIVWAVMVWFLPLDQYRFACSVVVRFVMGGFMLPFILTLTVILTLTTCRGVTFEDSRAFLEYSDVGKFCVAVMWYSLGCFLGPLVLLLSWGGPAGVAGVPFLGLPLTRLVLAKRDLTWVSKLCLGSSTPSGASQSTLEIEMMSTYS